MPLFRDLDGNHYDLPDRVLDKYRVAGELEQDAQLGGEEVQGGGGPSAQYYWERGRESSPSTGAAYLWDGGARGGVGAAYVWEPGTDPAQPHVRAQEYYWDRSLAGRLGQGGVRPVSPQAHNYPFAAALSAQAHNYPFAAGPRAAYNYAGGGSYNYGTRAAAAYNYPEPSDGGGLQGAAYNWPEPAYNYAARGGRAAAYNYPEPAYNYAARAGRAAAYNYPDAAYNYAQGAPGAAYNYPEPQPHAAYNYAQAGGVGAAAYNWQDPRPRPGYNYAQNAAYNWEGPEPGAAAGGAAYNYDAG